jgi:hypothetical protein
MRVVRARFFWLERLSRPIPPMMVIVFAAALGGLMAWIVWLLRRTPAPFWTGFVALVPVGLGVWCAVATASAFISADRVPDSLAVHEQVRQVAMHDARAYRWGMRFWAAGLVSAGWLLFVMWRWAAPSQPTRGEPPDAPW